MSLNQIFNALSDPTRRTLFERLCCIGEQNVRALTDYAGISQPAVSKHLGILKEVGLVGHRKEGRQTHYRAKPQALAPMVSWVAVHAVHQHRLQPCNAKKRKDI